MLFKFKVNYLRLLISIMFLVVNTAMYAYEHRNILQSAFTIDDLRSDLLPHQSWVPYPKYSDRVAWDRLMGSYKKQMVKRGEKYLDYQWQVINATDFLDFSRRGNRKSMEKPYVNNRKALLSLLLAELAEGKGRFLDDIIDVSYHFCEMTSWVLSAHLSLQKQCKNFPSHREHAIDLGAVQVGELMAWTYYFMHEAMDKVHPMIAERIKEELRVRILDAYMENNHFWWLAFNLKPGSMVNNWNPWCNSGVLQCFLLLEDDCERLSKAVYRTMRSVDEFLNYNHADGGCEEGTTYWQHAAGKLYDYLQLLYYATGGEVSIFDHPLVRNLGEFIPRSYVGEGWVVNFADASARANNNIDLVYRYGRAVKSQLMMDFAGAMHAKNIDRGITTYDIFELLESFESRKSILPATFCSPKYSWYPETQFCYMRNKANMFLAAKGGYNDESHNHNDVGSFSLYVNKRPVIIDAGVGTYTRKTFSSQRYTIWSMQSDYHNVPKINGVSQSYGRRYKARDICFDAKHSMFQLEMAGAYPKEAEVESWKRRYVLKDDALELTDTYMLSKSKKPNVLHFLTWEKPDLSRKGMIAIGAGNTVVWLKYDKQKLLPSVEELILKDPRFTKVWGNKIYRLTLKEKQFISNKGKLKLKFFIAK